MLTSLMLMDPGQAIQQLTLEASWHARGAHASVKAAGFWRKHALCFELIDKLCEKVVTKEAPCPKRALTSTVVRPYKVRFALEASAGLASVFGVGDCSEAWKRPMWFER